MRSKSIFCNKCFSTKVAKETFLSAIFSFILLVCVSGYLLCFNLIVYEQTSNVLQGLTSVSIQTRGVSRGNSAYTMASAEIAPLSKHKTLKNCITIMILPAFVCLWVTFNKSYKQIMINYFILIYLESIVVGYRKNYSKEEESKILFEIENRIEEL